MSSSEEDDGVIIAAAGLIVLLLRQKRSKKSVVSNSDKQKCSKTNCFSTKNQIDENNNSKIKDIHFKQTKDKSVHKIYCFHCKNFFKPNEHNLKKCFELQRKISQSNGNSENTRNFENIKNESETVAEMFPSEEPLHCKYCGRIFKFKYYLNRHESFHQRNELECKYCGKICKTPTGLQKHIKLHTNEKPYKCKVCSKAFRVISTLKTHIIYKHTNKRPYSCRIENCKSTFKTYNMKRQHEKRHLPGLYICEICGNSYKTNTRLSYHYQSKHVDAQNWLHECEICHRKFAYGDRLVDHSRIHTGEKPFGCDICPKFFRRKYTLREHKRLHSEENKYMCRFCGKGFKQAAGYWGHMKRHPNID